MKLRYLAVFAFLFFCTKPSAQPGYEILKDVNKIDIPFEFTNNLILVNVTFGRLFPLKFIFDTGAENTILSKREVTDALGFNYEREFKIMGSDLQAELTAYLVRGVYLNIEDMVAPNHSMLVLQEDYFNFEELLGIKVDGILGADIFRGLTVKIDYQRQVITLSKASSSKIKKDGFEVLPILIEKNKPYLQTTVRTQADSIVKVKLLLDTGAMLSLLLNSDSHPSLQPPENTIQGQIGAGLGGFLTGHLGRVNALSLGDLMCTQVVTNFQSYQLGMDSIKMKGRNGIIGNEILSRFLVIIDYPGQKLYLQPNRRYKNEFEFDKSGLVIIASDYKLKKFTVHSVITNSPAMEAGILKGDEIKRINGKPIGFFNLEQINKLLRKKEGKKIKIVVKRDGQRLKFEFLLRKLI